MIFSLLFSLFLTECAELGVGALLGLRSKKALAVVFLTNIVTNVPFVFFLRLRFEMGLPVSDLLIFALETLIFFTEFLIYRAFCGKTARALFYSFVLNGASFLLGVFVNMIHKWVIS